MNINLASRVTGFRIDAYGVNQYQRLQNDQNTELIEIDVGNGFLYSNSAIKFSSIICISPFIPIINFLLSSNSNNF